MDAIYARKGKLYYWSRQDGEVCVEPKMETPSMLFLRSCETGEPFRAIRRGEPWWNEMKRAAEPRTKRSVWKALKETLRDALKVQITEDVYRRDGKLYYWSTDTGEVQIRAVKDQGAWVLLPPKGVKYLFQAPWASIEQTHPLYGRMNKLMAEKNPAKRGRKQAKVDNRKALRKLMRI